MLIPFEPPPGLNSDDTAFAAEGRWADGNNARFRLGRAQTIGGWSKKGATAFTTARSTFAWQNQSNQEVVAIASTTAPKLQVNVAGTVSNVSPASITIGTHASMDLYGSTLIVSGNGGGIVQWDGNPSNVATAVTNAPATATCIVVTPERQLLALGTNEEVSTTFNGMCIRGSDIEDITSWTSLPTNNAFEHVLENGGTFIRDARMVGPYVAVWTDSALFVGQFIGDPAQTYRFTRIASNCGLIQNGAIVTFGSSAVWVSPARDFWAWTVGTEPERLTCSILKDFQANMRDVGGGTSKVIGWRNTSFNEAWFFYGDSRDASALTSRYVAFSIDEKVWFRGQLGRLAAGRTMIRDDAAIYKPYTIDMAGLIQVHETGATADGSALTWHIQSADYYFNESQRRVMVKGCIPDFEDQSGDVALTLTVRRRPQEAAVTKGPYTLTTATTKKDFRASGKIFTVKFSGSSTYARLGKPLFDTVMMGEG